MPSRDWRDSPPIGGSRRWNERDAGETAKQLRERLVGTRKARVVKKSSSNILVRLADYWSLSVSS